ncbi:ABC transporter permease [Achromobacter insolitus]|uniref:Putative D,D-dipeptide transport system permease protein DdpC n=1 Tax=Achromobacter insolitus TaxID=217204 RepID=A0A6S7EW53_9BURK|nr:ABC transporter permease [Achromobacter insolitus]CAB3929378.1 putative D,D-dipeptide transport system permease protein DdpC [Achromobacter insolitus]CAB3944879.1 putative D,D-dipeptide transport system permease protein DdpC [Achromobacter insolitus]
MFRQLIRRPGGAIAVAILVVIAVLALGGPMLAPFDPYEASFDILLGPNATNWLGTDYMGRDVLSRLLHGSSLSVLGAVQVVCIGLLLGVLPGMLSVFCGRSFEWASLRVVDTLIALPSLVFAVAVTALIGNGVSEAMFVVGVLVTPFFYRVARAAALEVAGQPYLQASVLMGASVWWLVRQHVWRKAAPAVWIAVATMTGHSLIVVSSLTFLGIGVQPPEPTWGGLLASDLQYLSQKPYAPVFPSLLIVLTVAALNLLADTMRDIQRRGAA